MFERRAWAGWLLPGLVGTMLSMARTGHVYGRWNNFFHLPILAGLPAMPQFANDAFIQTLRLYASGFWLLFAGVVPLEWSPAFLLTCAIVSRFLAILGFLACADLLGIRSLRERLLFVTLIAFSATLFSYSSAGSGGLFINYFTHSEVANATILFTIWLAARGRYAGAMAMNGATCFLNAFMAVWALAPMAAIAILQYKRGEIAWRTIFARVAIGTPLFVLLALPAFRAVLANPEFGHAPNFDYVTFLIEYTPIHFLVWTAGAGTLMTLAVIVAAGVMAAQALAASNRQAAYCLAALLSFCGLWLLGTILPFFTHSPTFINLHLLRASVGIHLMTGLVLAALPVIWIREEGPGRRFWAPLMILGSSLVRPMLLLSIGAMLFARSPRVIAPRWRLDRIVISLLALIWPVQIMLEARSNAAASDRVVEWRMLGAWAKAHTRPTDIFMLPISSGLNRFSPWTSAPGQEELENGAEVFETAAERRVWIDFRSGGAAAWLPSFYHLWRQRVAETVPLADHAQRMAYARAHGLAYLVDRCGQSGPMMFGVPPRCIYATGIVPQPLTQASNP